MSRHRCHTPNLCRGSFPFVAAALLLAACPNPQPSKFTVGGTVTGLAGTGLVLQNNLEDAVVITSNGGFTFPTALASGSDYIVTVFTQPTSPTQTCQVTRYAGKIGSSDVTDVAVTCTTSTYSIGGSVSGLSGSGLVLQNNAGDNVSVTSNGLFTFPSAVPSGGAYAVTVLTHPTAPSQTCTVANSTGTVVSAGISNVAVTCTTNAYAIGGAVSGLAGSGLVLQNNGSDDLAIDVDGAFAFPTTLASGSSYSVTVKTQPSSPTQTCAVTNGTGMVGGSAVTNVSVACTTTYSIGGIVSGLVSSGLVLASPGESDLSVGSGATAFTFAARLPVGSSYSVTVKTQPPGEACSVTNGAGTLASDVTNVDVRCVRLWSAIAAGATHSVGITTDGTLWAWGKNDFGQLGDGTTTYRAAPVRIGSGFATVAAGDSFTVAVKTDGTLWTWGLNDHAELCDDTLANRSMPAQVGSGFVTVAAGGAHTMATKPDGTLWACGFNSSGQLGDGSSFTGFEPVQIGWFSSVTAGFSHTAAVKADGTLWAWGNNSYGQVGDGTTTNRLSPVQVGSAFAMVAAGYDHTMAVKTDGSLWGWGRNFFGCLGDGTLTNRLTPVQVGAGFTTVAGGSSYTVGVKADGTLWAWGINSSGQLGDGTTTYHLTPVQVSSGFRKVATGSSHTIALKTDGTLWAWGLNTSGQLGDGTTTDRHTPVQIP